MKEVFRSWFNRYFSDPQAVFLLVALVTIFIVVFTMGKMIAPVLASIVIAYLLEGMAGSLEKLRVPRILAVITVYLFFIAALLLLIFGVLPQLSSQLSQLFGELPSMLDKLQQSILRLPESYPQLISENQINTFIADLAVDMKSMLGGMTQAVWSFSIASIQITVYLILVPILVFFFLKDKAVILAWFSARLPQERGLAGTVWEEVDVQIGNYIRGKFIEIAIVGAVSYTTFQFMGLQYAALLGMLVGLSVIIPYIGAVVVTIPVALVAYFQWGWTGDFAWLIFAYLVIQALDGNALVPLLFSEVVDLHPVAIIIAVLVFGGLWGFWGVFFAIPLATLVNALLKAWPRTPGSGATHQHRRPQDYYQPGEDLDQTLHIKRTPRD